MHCIGKENKTNKKTGKWEYRISKVSTHAHMTNAFLVSEKEISKGIFFSDSTILITLISTKINQHYITIIFVRLHRLRFISMP